MDNYLNNVKKENIDYWFLDTWLYLTHFHLQTYISHDESSKISLC